MGKIIDYGDYVNGSDWIRVEMPKESTHQHNVCHMVTKHINVQLVNWIYFQLTPKYSYASQYDVYLKDISVVQYSTKDSLTEFLKPCSAKDTLELFSPITDNAGFAGDGFLHGCSGN